ncbi:MAG TPA: flagellar brake protein [Burkholderiaceae bacterium]
MDNWHDYRVESRREIIALMRALSDKGQMIKMAINGNSDSCITSILEVDVDNDLLYLDRSIDREQNRRMVAAPKVSFDTALDKIRIMFATHTRDDCEYTERPALCMEIPESVVRLQRRELFRMTTPVVNPVRCAIVLPEDLGEGTVFFPLADISGGGIAMLDEKTVLDNTIGRIYKGCRIDIPDIGVITCSLQIRSSQDLTLLNGKTNRRLGCLFMEMPRSNQGILERYITKLQRELAAKLGNH